MIKTISLLSIYLSILMLTSSSAWAYKGLHCFESENSSVYFLQKNAEGFLLTINHLGGEGSIPIASQQDLIAIGNLDWLKKKAEIFKAMGEKYQIQFTNEMCVLSRNMRVGICEIIDHKISDVELRSMTFSFNIADGVSTERKGNVEISLEWNILDTSKYFSGKEKGSSAHIHRLAIDLNFQDRCSFRGFEL